MGVTGAALGEIRVDRVSVNVEKRANRDWVIVEAQVSGPIEADPDAVAAVIQDYGAYSAIFPHIQDASAQPGDNCTLLSETMVVDTFGFKNINRFTLRMQGVTTPAGFHLGWTQEHTDGTIDGLEGEWVLENRGTADKPLTWVTYRTKSAVLVTAFGQDLLLRMFLGGETKALIEAVAKKIRIAKNSRPL
jgi:hypothetical protein